MSQATYITGDVRDVLATIPDGSVDLVMTSPPFLALRSYLPATVRSVPNRTLRRSSPRCSG